MRSILISSAICKSESSLIRHNKDPVIDVIDALMSFIISVLELFSQSSFSASMLVFV